ncbi:hypothetical protein A9K97_gp306 [Tokyovirus A1]|uniref:hypothetical protein n=1 Tax=Tokyovirus A1 TaxID=1826170 RepID=UPI0007A97C80|nr:hypothetical protein A9K97_gp306 [Tokyovirus A1]BAU80045.1 hypothetical protein [Tokyovirus A1]
MHKFLERREVTSFSLNGSFCPRKQNFETTTQNETETLTALPDGSVVRSYAQTHSLHGETITKERKYKKGRLHGKFSLFVTLAEQETKRVEGKFRNGKLHGRWTLYDKGRVESFTFVKGKLMEWTSHHGETHSVISHNEKKGELHVLEKKGEKTFQCHFFEMMGKREIHSSLGVAVPARTYKNYKCFTRTFSPSLKKQLVQNFKERGFWKGRLKLARPCLYIECPHVRTAYEEMGYPIIVSAFRPGE